MLWILTTLTAPTTLTALAALTTLTFLLHLPHLLHSLLLLLTGPAERGDACTQHASAARADPNSGMRRLLEGKCSRGSEMRESSESSACIERGTCGECSRCVVDVV